MEQSLVALGTTMHPVRFVVVRFLTHLITIPMGWLLVRSGLSIWMAIAVAITVVQVISRWRDRRMYQHFALTSNADQGARVRGSFVGGDVSHDHERRVVRVEMLDDTLRFVPDGNADDPALELNASSFRPDSLRVLAAVSSDVIAGRAIDVQALAGRRGVSVYSHQGRQNVIWSETPNVLLLTWGTLGASALFVLAALLSVDWMMSN